MGIMDGIMNVVGKFATLAQEQQICNSVAEMANLSDRELISEIKKANEQEGKFFPMKSKVFQGTEAESIGFERQRQALIYVARNRGRLIKGGE
jgi:Flp pilus assembly CpaE family ATPase